MAITVGANGYISVADFRQWGKDRGRELELLEFLDSDIEAAITIASVDFLDARYSFRGTKSASTQPMKLPTDKVAIADIKNPVAHAVYRQLKGTLLVQPTAPGESKGVVASETKQLGPLSTSVTYETGTSRQGGERFRTDTIDTLLRPFLANGTGGIQMLRA